MQLDFVAADVVRFRYTMETAFLGNQTGVCLPRTEQQVSFTLSREGESVVAASDSLTVKVDLNTLAVSYHDTRSGRLLLRCTRTVSPSRKVWFIKARVSPSFKELS